MSNVPTRPRLLLHTAPPPDPRRRRWPALAARLAPVVLTAAAAFLLAFENGGYGLTSRTIAAFVAWGLVIAGFGLGILPRAATPRAVQVGALLLAAFAAWTLASATWGDNAEKSFVEFNRVTLYLGVFVLAAALGSRRTIDRYADGLQLGVVAVAVLALLSRIFPRLGSASDIPTLLPSAASRLSYPVGYWNGLAILVSFALPLCLRRGLTGRSATLRALSVAPVPALATVVFLASSRGGVVTSLIAAVAFVGLAGDRWRAAGVLVASALASGAAVAFVSTRHAFVTGPVDSHAALVQGRVALAVVLVCCAVASSLAFAVERVCPRPPAIGRRTFATAGALLAIAVAAAAVAAHPVRRFDEFKQLPQFAGASNFTTAHLTSGSGSGRWQFWTAAVDEFRSAPLHGRGAGAYEFWWSQHAPFTYTLKNAHSLYLETLGDLGVVGLLLIVSALLVPFLAAVMVVRRAEGDERTTLAALAAVGLAFLVGAGIDWIFQLAAVSAVAFAAVGLASVTAVGPAPAGTAPRPRSRIALAIVALAAAWAIVCAQAIPWLAARKIGDSQAAVRQGQPQRAIAAALDAKSLEPWAAAPYLQLGLVAEQTGSYDQAHRWLLEAADRAPTDWRVWYVAARVSREAGDPRAAAREYARAKSLNPRSPLFS